MRKFNLKLRSKYNAKRTIIDGINFASKKEASRYEELKVLRSSGDILFFLMQVPFHLEAGIKYVCDFLVFWNNGNVSFEDVKGRITPVYRVKKKQVESKYPIEITEIV